MDVQIQRTLASSDLVEHIIAMGADHPNMALPIACTFIKLRSGKISMSNRADGEIEMVINIPVHETTELALIPLRCEAVSASC